MMPGTMYPPLLTRSQIIGHDSMLGFLERRAPRTTAVAGPSNAVVDAGTTAMEEELNAGAAAGATAVNTDAAAGTAANMNIDSALPPQGSSATQHPHEEAEESEKMRLD